VLDILTFLVIVKNGGPMEYKTIKVEQENAIFRITLNRPEVRNAFNMVMIEELMDVFTKLYDDNAVRIIVLTGGGTAFCAGADLNWMKDVMELDFEENFREVWKLGELLHLMYSIPKPLIGRINGPAIGGGTGITAVCDIATASENAVFSFSEVTIGLVPADISPYIIRKCGEAKTREYFITGKRLSAREAKEANLVNKVVSRDELDNAVDEYISYILRAGPNALGVCKDLLEKVPLMDFNRARDYTAYVLARLRMGKEAQEGMKAFLEKRIPVWRDND